MHAQPQQTWRNPLVRRVHRHTRLATLFRSAEQAFIPTYGAQTAAQPTGPVSQELDSALQAIQPPQAGHQPLDPVPVPLPVEESTTRSSGPAVQRATAPSISGEHPPASGPGPHSPPVVPPETTRQGNDREWHRLQAIFRKHQEQKSAEPVTSKNQPSTRASRRDSIPVPVPPPEVGLAVDSLNRPEPASQPSHQPDALQAGIESVPQIPATASPREESSLQRSEQVGPKSAPEIWSESPSSGTAGRATRQVPSAGSESPLPQPEVEEAPSQPHLQAASNTRQGLEAMTQDLAHPAEPAPAPIGRELAARSPADAVHDVGSLPGPLPLQAVWPVQRVEGTPVPAAYEPQEMESPAGTPKGTKQSLPASDGVQETLSNVAPGQSAKPAPEMIAPRRPRPGPDQAASEQKQARLEPDVEPDVPEGARSEVIQRVSAPSRPEPDREPSAGTLEGTDHTAVDGTNPEPISKPDRRGSEGHQPGPLPSATISRSLAPNPPAPSMPPAPGVEARRDDSRETGAPKESTLIQTAIGPLPADLWDLVGEDPPGSSRPETGPAGAAPPAGQELAAHAARPPVAPEQIAGAVCEQLPSAESEWLAGIAHRPAAPVAPEQLASTTQATGPLLPGEDMPEDWLPDASVGQRSQTSFEGRQSQAGAGPDTDELARRVYVEVRRRLSLEWERVRSRF